MKEDEEDKDTVGREENGEEIGEIYNIRGSPYSFVHIELDRSQRRGMRINIIFVEQSVTSEKELNILHTNFFVFFVFVLVFVFVPPFLLFLVVNDARHCVDKSGSNVTEFWHDLSEGESQMHE